MRDMRVQCAMRHIRVQCAMHHTRVLSAIQKSIFAALLFDAVCCAGWKLCVVPLIFCEPVAVTIVPTTPEPASIF
jgi:hypothetical protein